MNRPYLALVIVAALSVSAARGLPGDPAGSADLAGILERMLRFGVVVSGALALRALWRGRETARRLTAEWATCVIGFVALQDLMPGYVRPGVGDRLVMMALITAVVTAAVWRVPRRLPFIG